jgi:hypothetical protein
METSSKNFRPFVYIILGLGLIVALSIAAIYGKLFEDVEHEKPDLLTPSTQEKLEGESATP